MKQLVGRQIGRAVKVAYINAQNRVPRDTGTLAGSLKLSQTPNGYRMYFKTTDINPKSHKPVKAYIDYVERYHNKWWESIVKSFFNDMNTQLGGTIKKAK